MYTSRYITNIVFPGECIQSAASSNSSEMDILNNFNKSTCMTLNGKSDDTNLVITKLQVNKTCVNGQNVSKVGNTGMTCSEFGV